jgi:arylsulfatase A-like enzyme
MSSARPTWSRVGCLVLVAAALVAAACDRGSTTGEAERADAASSGPPFARAGSSRDLLCDVERAVREAGAVPSDVAPCDCGDVAATVPCRHVDVGLDRRRGVTIAAPASLALPLDAGDASALRFSVAVSGKRAAELDVAVALRSPGGDERASWRRRLGVAREWTDVSLELPPGTSGTLTVTVEPAPAAASGTAHPRLLLAMPRLVTPTREATGDTTNVVVYLIDTLRPDHTSAYGYARDTTPSLARLAREGVRFDAAYSTAARTRPATASLLTSLHPGFHGAHSGFALSPRVATLAERFRAAGWSTWAFVTNGHVHGRQLNFDQGFDRFQAVRGKRLRNHARTEEVNEVLFPHLDALADEPFLLYVHTVDPHAPYEPPPAFRGRFTDPGYAGPVRPEKTITADLERLRLDDEDVAHVAGLYDEDIRYQDEMLGLLLARLETLGIAERTVVVVVSDHGEEFQEHGAWAHGGRLWEEQIRVPLIVRVPRWSAAAGRTVREPVQIIDVMPTLLAWFGLEGGDACQGRDVSDLVRGEPSPQGMERPIYGEETTYTPGAELRSFRVGAWKAIRFGLGDDLSKTHVLFNLDEDPLERRNLAPSQRRRLWDLARQQEAEARRWAASFERQQGPPERLDARTREQLEALGYVMR